MVCKRKNGNFKSKMCAETRINTSLKDLSVAFLIKVGMIYFHF